MITTYVINYYVQTTYIFYHCFHICYKQFAHLQKHFIGRGFIETSSYQGNRGKIVHVKRKRKATKDKWQVFTGSWSFIPFGKRLADSRNCLSWRSAKYLELKTQRKKQSRSVFRERRKQRTAREFTHSLSLFLSLPLSLLVVRKTSLDLPVRGLSFFFFLLTVQTMGTYACDKLKQRDSSQRTSYFRLRCFDGTYGRGSAFATCLQNRFHSFRGNLVLHEVGGPSFAALRWKNTRVYPVSEQTTPRIDLSSLLDRPLFSSARRDNPKRVVKHRSSVWRTNVFSDFLEVYARFVELVWCLVTRWTDEILSERKDQTRPSSGICAYVWQSYVVLKLWDVLPSVNILCVVYDNCWMI